MLLASLLSACQSSTPRAINIVDGETIQTLQTTSRDLNEIFAEGGTSVTDSDRLLLDGQPFNADTLPTGHQSHTLQIQRAIPVSLSRPERTQVLLTSAATVGETLHEAGVQLYAVDFLDPPAGTSLNPDRSIRYRPSQALTISTAFSSLAARSAAHTVGAALSEAGLSLQELDYSLPAASEALPSDGSIRLVRVAETIQLAQNSLPFTSEFIASADVELDQQQILQPGITGLSVRRVRIRFEDGQEVSRQSEPEVTIRPPQNRVLGYGTKVTIRTENVGGVQIEYWRALNLFATSYSPCRSAADRCYYGTSSGKPVQQGIVAVKYNWYLLMQGQPVYIPGYGFASIEDVGGGIPGTPWIDLGYSDNDWVEWGDWVTVYFLTPVPANVPYLLD